MSILRPHRILDHKIVGLVSQAGDNLTKGIVSRYKQRLLLNLNSSIWKSVGLLSLCRAHSLIIVDLDSHSTFSNQNFSLIALSNYTTTASEVYTYKVKFKIT